MSKRVDENAVLIAANASEIAAGKSRTDGHDAALSDLSERVRNLEQKPQITENQTNVRACLSQEYLLARRSIRL